MDKLYLPNVTKRIIDRYGFKFSKSLGQNFLIDDNIINKIINGADVNEEDIIIEVGPGIGTLTQAIARKAKKVIAIEIDNKLIGILKETLQEFDNIEVVNQDILKTDINNLIKEYPNKRIKVIANLPYYITTPVIMKFLEERIPLKSMVVMIQKEVAERLNAKPSTKEYGAISVLVQYYCKTELVTKVPKTVFIPQPKVDSAVIKLELYDKPRIYLNNEKNFYKIVKASFAQRRKTLLNTLSNSLNYDKDYIKTILEKSQIDPRRRGETLTLEEFARLANNML